MRYIKNFIRIVFGRPFKKRLFKKINAIRHHINRAKKRHRRIQALLCRDGQICAECGRELIIGLKTRWSHIFLGIFIGSRRYPDGEKKTYVTIDHIIPRCRGGKNNIENLRLLHRSCNMRKGDQLR